MKKAILRFSLLILCILTKVQAEDGYNEALRDMLELKWSTEQLSEMGEYLLMASPNDERAMEIKSELLKQNNLSAIFLISPVSDLELIGLSINERDLILLMQRIQNGDSPIMLEDVKDARISGDKEKFVSIGFQLDSLGAIKGRLIFRAKKTGDKWIPIDLEVITPNSDKPFSLFNHYHQNNLFQILRTKALHDLNSNSQSDATVIMDESTDSN